MQEFNWIEFSKKIYFPKTLQGFRIIKHEKQKSWIITLYQAMQGGWDTFLPAYSPIYLGNEKSLVADQIMLPAHLLEVFSVYKKSQTKQKNN